MDKVEGELAKGGSDAKLSVADLKAFLKAKSMSQTGDKPTLWHRAKLHQQCEVSGLRVESGKAEERVSPCALKPAALKKACARAGVSPIGSNDELLTAIVQHLAKQGPAARAPSSASSSASSSEKKLDPIALAARVLGLCDVALVEPVAVLRLADQTVTPQSPTAQLRKAYLKLSLAIHPDRIGRQFPEATKAFQVLVTAFERLTQPELVPDGQDDQSEGKSGSKAKKTARISRSNEGCVRTSVHCPRCKQAWGAAVEGNPDWFYNVMMQGLKSFTCATCLCQFGCMTALHKCPQCARTFEYSPQDYHRRVGCGHPKCISSTASKGFGFFLFSMSDRAEAALRAELKTAREQHAKVVESARRRAASVAKRRGGGGQGVDAEAEAQASEAAFAAGLSDSCPRCGGSFLAMGGEEDQRQHLLECTDAKAIKATRRQLPPLFPRTHTLNVPCVSPGLSLSAAPDCACLIRFCLLLFLAWVFIGARGEETQGGGGGGVQGLAGGVAGRRRGPGHVAVPWLQARAALPPLGAPARQAVPGPGDRPASEYAEQLAQDERGRRREESGAHLGARAVGRLGGPLGGGAEKAGQTRRIDTSGELGVPQPRSAAGRSRSARLCVGARLGLGKRHQGRAPGPCPGRTMRRARRQ